MNANDDITGQSDIPPTSVYDEDIPF